MSLVPAYRPLGVRRVSWPLSVAGSCRVSATTITTHDVLSVPAARYWGSGIRATSTIFMIQNTVPTSQSSPSTPQTRPTQAGKA